MSEVTIANKGFPFFQNLLLDYESLKNAIEEVESCYPQENHYGGISFVMRYNTDVANIRLFLNFSDLIDIQINGKEFRKNIHVNDLKKILTTFNQKMFLGSVVSFNPKEEE